MTSADLSKVPSRVTWSNGQNEFVARAGKLGRQILFWDFGSFAPKTCRRRKTVVWKKPSGRFCVQLSHTVTSKSWEIGVLDYAVGLLRALLFHTCDGCALRIFLPFSFHTVLALSIWVARMKLIETCHMLVGAGIHLNRRRQGSATSWTHTDSHPTRASWTIRTSRPATRYTHLKWSRFRPDTTINFFAVMIVQNDTRHSGVIRQKS